MPSDEWRKQRENSSVQLKYWNTVLEVELLVLTFVRSLPLSKKLDLKSFNVREHKTDCELFSRLYIACQSWNGDMDEFFRHENQSYPPSISDRGKLRFGTKCKSLACFKSVSESTQDIANLQTDTYAMDGVAWTKHLNDCVSKTFEQYSEKLFEHCGKDCMYGEKTGHRFWCLIVRLLEIDN